MSGVIQNAHYQRGRRVRRRDLVSLRIDGEEFVDAFNALGAAFTRASKPLQEAARAARSASFELNMTTVDDER